MKKLIASLALLLLFIVFQHQAASGKQKPKPKPVVDEGIAKTSEANLKFAMDFYRELSKTSDKEANLFCSPYSLSTALGMTAAGANGSTRDEMENTLKLNDLKDPHLRTGELIRALNGNGDKEARRMKLNVANAIWGSVNFKKEYLQVTGKEYDAALQCLNFSKDPEAARKIINKWVEEKTETKIPELIKEGDITPQTVTVLTNAIYFKGNWALSFDEKLTREESFKTANGSEEKTPMMKMAEERFPFAEIDKTQIIQLPYENGEASMYVVLPENPEALRELEKNLSLESMQAWEKELKTSSVKVSFPKFKIDCGCRPADILQTLGMKEAFSPSNADFTNMMEGISKGEVYISKVIHQAVVEVNEVGTEAAAATAVIMKGNSVRPDSAKEFRADRPFFFYIKDHSTNSVLFMGRLMNPKK